MKKYEVWLQEGKALHFWRDYALQHDAEREVLRLRILFNIRSEIREV